MRSYGGVAPRPMLGGGTAQLIGGNMRRIAKFIVLIGAFLFLSGCHVEVRDGQGCWDKASVDPALIGVWKNVENSSLTHVIEKDGAYDITEDGVKHLEDFPANARSIAAGSYRFLVFFDPEKKAAELYRYEVKGDSVTFYVINGHVSSSSGIDIAPYLAANKSEVSFASFDDLAKALAKFPDAKLSYDMAHDKKLSVKKKKKLEDKTLWHAQLRCVRVQ